MNIEKNIAELKEIVCRLETQGYTREQALEIIKTITLIDMSDTLRDLHENGID